MVIKPGNLASLNDIPDRLPPVPSGVYILLIKTATVADNKDKTGQNLVLELSTVSTANGSTDTPGIGRSIRMYIGLPNGTDSQDEQIGKLIRLKNLWAACNLTPGSDGFDTNTLAGQKFLGEVAPNVYVVNGVQQEGSQIKNVLKTDGSKF